MLDRSSSSYITRSAPRMEELPEQILEEFTFGGRIKLLNWYINEKDWTQGDKVIWTKKIY